ncbi:TPA: glycosyltransferase family 2 protein [Vibrio cholerae]
MCKVSFIVPIYNVEMYIEKCVMSLTKQTVKDIEIILINDGSPDGSRKIVERMALDDHRITVVNTPNYGVSAARNLGLKIATGEYIAFVDGDDYLASDFLEYMLDIADKTKSDFVLSVNCHLFPGEIKQTESILTEIWDSDRTLTNLMYPGRIEIGCWNKLFRRSFIMDNKLEFPTNFYMGEGLSFIMNAAKSANVIAAGNKKVYYYRKDNAQSATTVVNVKKYINALQAIDAIDISVEYKSKDLLKSFALHRALTTMGALSAMVLTNNIMQYAGEFISFKREIRKNAFLLLGSKITIRQKLKVVIFCLNPKLLKIIC